MKQPVYWLTRTAIAIALLVVIQLSTAGLGNTLITGSLVNLLLIVATILAGPQVGITTAILSPVFAKLFGIGPLWPLIPFIAVGNCLLVICWYLVDRKQQTSELPYIVTGLLAAVSGAIVKALFLYLTIVKFVIPVLLSLPPVKVQVISTMFSFPQLITALIGGGIAILILPVLRKGVRSAN